jgi:hypothetical protein
MQTSFLNTPVGSYIKSFLIILLAFVIQSGDVFSVDWKQALSASIISFIPAIIKAITGAENGFWNSAYGSYLKSALTVGLAFIVQNGSIYGLNYHALINAMVMGLATVVINAVNPGDLRYGLKK